MHELHLGYYLFFEHRIRLTDYLSLDDGVMNTYFQSWIDGPDRILSDLAQRYINRKVLKSITFKAEEEEALDRLRSLVADVRFDPEYYTAIHHNFGCRMTFTDRMQKRNGLKLRFIAKMKPW